MHFKQVLSRIRSLGKSVIDSRRFLCSGRSKVTAGLIGLGVLVLVAVPTAFGQSTEQNVLDNDFGTDGKVITSIGSGVDVARDIVIDNDVEGKLVVVGYSDNGTNDDFALARYDIDGTLDTTFGTDGKITTDVRGGDDQSYSAVVQHQYDESATFDPAASPYVVITAKTIDLYWPGIIMTAL